MAGPNDVEKGGSSTPCPRCGETEFDVREYGRRVARFCAAGHRQADVRPAGDSLTVPRHSDLTPADAAEKRSSRAQRCRLDEHLVVAVLQSERCFYCGTKPFSMPLRASDVRAWLEAEKPSLWGHVRNHFRRRPNAFAIVPPDWALQISPELQAEISEQLASSKLQADHLIAVPILELLEGSVPQKLLAFGGRRLAVPACVDCKRGRVAAGMGAPHVLLERWISFYYDGNRMAAHADPQWPAIEVLVREAYKIASDLRALQRRL